MAISKFKTSENMKTTSRKHSFCNSEHLYFLNKLYHKNIFGVNRGQGDCDLSA